MGSTSSTAAATDSRPRITIVTLYVNDLRGLQSTVESVRAQTLLPHQWMVAGGQSTDGTQAWLGMPTTHRAMCFRRDALPDGFDARYRRSGDCAAVARHYLAHRGTDIAHLRRLLCRFHLGGRRNQHRRAFLRAKLDIRRRVLGMGAVPAYMLHGAHHVQGCIKQNTPRCG